MGSKNKDNNNNIIKYPQAKIILEEMRIAYQVENERKRTLDSKASAFITINIAILTIYIPLIPLSQIFSFFRTAEWYMKSLEAVCLIILTVGVFFSMMAFKWLVDGYSNKEYRYFDVDGLLNAANVTEQYRDGVVENGIIAHYHNILRGTLDELGNMRINNDRAKVIQRGIKDTVKGFCLISFSTMAMRIIMGG